MEERLKTCQNHYKFCLTIEYYNVTFEVKSTGFHMTFSQKIGQGGLSMTDSSYLGSKIIFVLKKLKLFVPRFMSHM